VDHSPVDDAVTKLSCSLTVWFRVGLVSLNLRLNDLSRTCNESKEGEEGLAGRFGETSTAPHCSLLATSHPKSSISRLLQSESGPLRAVHL